MFTGLPHALQGGSADLRIGREVRFGASTRSYVLRRTEADVSSGDGKRKRGVQWPDEIPPDSKRDRPALAQVSISNAQQTGLCCAR